MKRTVIMRTTTPSRSISENERPHYNHISLPREPWHIDTPPAPMPRPTERPLYAIHGTFGASTVRAW